MENYVTKNDLYNKMCCHNCWYIITILEPDETYTCPCCKRSGKELVEFNKQYVETYLKKEDRN